MHTQRQQGPGSKSSRALYWGLLLAMALLVCPGCSWWHAFWGSGSPALGVRPASGDTARLLRNAQYLQATGRPALALRELEEAYQLEPANPKVVDALAACYESLGWTDRAQKLYKRALAPNGGNRALQNNLCYSYYQSGKLKQAEACFRKELERHPDNVAARNNLGLLLCRTDRREEARRLWQAAEGEARAGQKVQAALTVLGMAAPARLTETTSAPPRTTVVAPDQVRPQLSPAAPGPGGHPPPPRAVAVAHNGRPYLTTQELLETAIEVQNGNGIPRAARRVRELLSGEGYDAVSISNCRDFGREETTIYCRPQAERVGLALQHRFFQRARLERRPDLPGQDVVVVLGRDLRDGCDSLAQLVEPENRHM